MEFNLKNIDKFKLKKIIEEKKKKETERKLTKNIEELNIKEMKKQEIKNADCISEHKHDNCKTYQKEDVENTLECLICLSSDIIKVKYDCGHEICVKCSIKLIWLSKDKACPICKQPSDHKIESDFLNYYLDYKCQICKKKNKIFNTKKELVNHYKELHKILTCSECIESQIVFPFEYSLYKSANLLQIHKREGLYSENISGFIGHMFCSYCDKYYYSTKEFIKHLRFNHEICTLCDKNGNRHVYFKNKDDISLHIKKEHYVCSFDDCQGISFCHSTELFEHMVRFHKFENKNLRLSDLNKNKKDGSEIQRINIYLIEDEMRKKALKKQNEKKLLDNRIRKNTTEKNNLEEKKFDLSKIKTEQISEDQKKNIKINSYFQDKKSNINRKNDITKNIYNDHKNTIVSKKILNTEQNSIIEVPDYLKRSVIQETKEKQKITINFINGNYPLNQKDIYDILFLFQNKNISAQIFLERISLLIGSKETIKFSENIIRYITNEDCKKDLKNYHNIFKEKVLFPPFQRKPTEEDSNKNNTKYGFKVINMSKKKK